jgi:hypothetical protein
MQEFRSGDDQRMTDEEAQLVMRILAERKQQREELQAMPTVKDVAQMANADPEEVHLALAELRTKPMPSVTVYEERARKNPLPIFAAAAAVVLLLVGSAAVLVPSTEMAATEVTASGIAPTAVTEMPPPLPLPPGAPVPTDSAWEYPSNPPGSATIAPAPTTGS